MNIWLEEVQSPQIHQPSHSSHGGDQRARASTCFRWKARLCKSLHATRRDRRTKDNTELSLSRYPWRAKGWLHLESGRSNNDVRHRVLSCILHHSAAHLTDSGTQSNSNESQRSRTVCTPPRDETVCTHTSEMRDTITTLGTNGKDLFLMWDVSTGLWQWSKESKRSGHWDQPNKISQNKYGGRALIKYN